MAFPRGIRNANPGNIRKSDIQWQGAADIQADPDFVIFSAPQWGVRALMKVLRNYVARDGADETVRGLVSRWAPASENDAAAYIRDVAQLMRVNPDSPLDLGDEETLVRLAQAITLRENGRPPAELPGAWYPPDLFCEAFQLLTQGEEI